MNGDQEISRLKIFFNNDLKNKLALKTIINFNPLNHVGAMSASVSKVTAGLLVLKHKNFSWRNWKHEKVN